MVIAVEASLSVYVMDTLQLHGCVAILLLSPITELVIVLP